MTQNELFLRFVTRRVSVARIKGRVDWATARGPYTDPKGTGDVDSLFESNSL